MAGAEPQLVVEYEPYPLKLRTAFGTSHSSTTTRTNMLVHVTVRGRESTAATTARDQGEIRGEETQGGAAEAPASGGGSAAGGEGLEGWGEVGLPPRKAGVYDADLASTAAFLQRFVEHWQAATDGTGSTGTNVLADDELITSVLPAGFFPELHAAACTVAPIDRLILRALRALDECLESDADPAVSRAAASGLEVALLDVWGRARRQPLFRLIGLKADPPRPGFFTAALQPEIEEIVQSAEFGRPYTPFLKIKLDADLARNTEILRALRQALAPAAGTWSLDANAAWTPALALAHLELLASDEFAGIVYMVEQPFAVRLEGPEAVQAWAEVKAAYGRSGIFIYADESVCTAADVGRLEPVCHGVNFKLEKAGGIRGALRGIQQAQKLGMLVWLGVMVGSTLNSVGNAHLLPLAGHGDLDGSLLVDAAADRFTGGFSWADTGHILLPDIPGHGVRLKSQ